MKKLIQKILNLKLIWWGINCTLGTIARIFSKLYNAKKSGQDEIAQFLKAKGKVGLFSELIVRNGPFKGMLYPSKKAFGSEFYPKLLGSYEQEITPAISYIIHQPYTAIVDVGCAEGYYAIGLGRHLPKAKIFAFDTNQKALAFCREMGKLNQVEVHTGNFCNKTKLLELDLGERALIFCDCEGYEIQLIDHQVAEHLKKHDFLIETHDFININITKQLLEVLGQTHDCQVYESTEDILKAYNYQLPELEGFNLEERRSLLAESRPQIMRWIFAKARS